MEPVIFTLSDDITDWCCLSLLSSMYWPNLLQQFPKSFPLSVIGAETTWKLVWVQTQNVGMSANVTQLRIVLKQQQLHLSKKATSSTLKKTIHQLRWWISKLQQKIARMGMKRAQAALKNEIIIQMVLTIAFMNACWWTTRVWLHFNCQLLE